jgi:type IV pilus assembly protein PilQ
MRFYIVTIILLLACAVQAQVIKDSIAYRLDEKAKTLPILKHKINTSVSEVSLEEFLRAIALTNNLNLDIDNNLNAPVVNNFSDVMVKDMLVYLCEEYDLHLVFTGNIISIKKNLKPKQPYIQKVMPITYDSVSNLISFDFRNDTLGHAVKQITQKSGKNVILEYGLANEQVTAYIQHMPFESALDKLAFAHKLKVKKTEDGFYLLEKDKEAKVSNPQQQEQVQENSRRRSRRSSSGKQGESKSGTEEEALKIEYTNNLLSIQASEADLNELIHKVSEETGTGYLLLTKIEGKVTLNLVNVSYADVIDHVLKGTKYISKVQDGIFIIGDASTKELAKTRFIEFKRRSVEKITESLPDNLTKDLTIKEFIELNGLIVSGSENRIAEFEAFIQTIDKKVPVVLIEVIIAYVSKSDNVSTGIDAGIADAPVTSGGTLNAGLDFNLSANLLNNMINSFDGFGWLNLSKVHPNFYVSLKALEEIGYLEIKSTPKLSTINGNAARMKIGNKQYYLEEQTNIIGTQNPQTSTTKTYKEINADLSVDITPFVSGEEDITMNIKVIQSDFTEKISKYAPPGTVNREFESLIRVKNGEMILLGGLEDVNNSQSSSGWPILAKIPVIKWIFSSMSKNKSKSKLNVFIKPTIL